mmetsp:Transcript_34523/g.88557  ORF Transcript_34523/g.88557 Transcript_34523/m.88557 type:complete len:292 (+) Transcript_34523:546-1421(+)
MRVVEPGAVLPVSVPIIERPQPVQHRNAPGRHRVPRLLRHAVRLLAEVVVRVDTAEHGRGAMGDCHAQQLEEALLEAMLRRSALPGRAVRQALVAQAQRNDDDVRLPRRDGLLEALLRHLGVRATLRHVDELVVVLLGQGLPELPRPSALSPRVEALRHRGTYDDDPRLPGLGIVQLRPVVELVEGEGFRLHFREVPIVHGHLGVLLHGHAAVVSLFQVHAALTPLHVLVLEPRAFGLRHVNRGTLPQWVVLHLQRNGLADVPVAQGRTAAHDAELVAGVGLAVDLKAVHA